MRIKGSFDTIKISYNFLYIAEKNGIRLDNLKLACLIYFAHGWYLAIYNKPLINEFIQASKYGPKIKTLDMYLHYGNSAITPEYWHYNWKKERIKDKILNKFLEEFWEKYNNFTSIQLSNLSHDIKGPWNKTRNNYNFKMYISNEEIRNYFIKM
jgi:uncharacterized phage-associated protein